MYFVHGEYQEKRAPGGIMKYSNKAIETILSLGYVFRLALRQTTGFAESVFKMLNINLEAPDYSTLSRRSKKLDSIIKKAYSKVNTNTGINLVIDSTGLSIYDASGWHRVKYGEKSIVKEIVGENYI